MSNSIHYNGTDLSGASYGLTVEKGTVPVLSSPRRDVQSSGRGYGGAQVGTGFEPLTISINAQVIGSSESDLTDKLDALTYLLDPQNGEKSIRFDDWKSGRYWKGVLASALDPQYQNPSSVKLQLQFVCVDARAYRTTDVSTDYTISATPQALTIPATGAVVGNAKPDPTWIIKNTSGGSVSSIVFANSTTGETVTLTATLANNNWLRITTGMGGTVEKSTDSGGSWTSAISYASLPLVPSLAPNVANSITVTGLSAGTLSLTYTPRYL